MSEYEISRCVDISDTQDFLAMWEKWLQTLCGWNHNVLATLWWRMRRVVRRHHCWRRDAELMIRVAMALEITLRNRRWMVFAAWLGVGRIWWYDGGWLPNWNAHPIVIVWAAQKQSGMHINFPELLSWWYNGVITFSRWRRHIWAQMWCRSLECSIDVARFGDSSLMRSMGWWWIMG